MLAFIFYSLLFVACLLALPIIVSFMVMPYFLPETQRYDKCALVIVKIITYILGSTGICFILFKALPFICNQL